LRLLTLFLVEKLQFNLFKCGRLELFEVVYKKRKNPTILGDLGIWKGKNGKRKKKLFS
jgi:hypothetical protein